MGVYFSGFPRPQQCLLILLKEIVSASELLLAILNPKRPTGYIQTF